MQLETWLKTDLKKPLKVESLESDLFSDDNEANLIGVEVTSDGVPVELSGVVTGYVVTNEGVTVTLSGTISGNKAQVILNHDCYTSIGTLSIVIKVGTTTIGACHGYVYRTSTDAIVDPSHVIPSLQELLDQIENCRQATTDATAAATAANTAATNANEKAGLANTAATNANEKAGLANTAAQAINSLSASATTGAAGSQASAEITEVEGHKNIAIVVPKGDTGLTPAISIGTTTTLTEGSDATVTMRGTAENPIFDFGIPKGQPGDINNAYGTSINISSNDSTKIKTYIDNAIQTEQTARATAIQTEQTARGDADNALQQRVGTLEQNALTVDAVIDALYPVGSTYISMNSTMPTALTTGRTWEAITGEYVLKTVTTGSGGEYTAAGDTGSTALTIAQMPSHTHSGYWKSLVTGGSGAITGADSSGNAMDAGGSITQPKGGGQGHTHTAGMPANVSVYMWKRTA